MDIREELSRWMRLKNYCHNGSIIILYKIVTLLITY